MPRNFTGGLGWDTHISSIVKKVCTGIFMIRTLRFSVSQKILIAVYYAYIYSHLSYGVILWGNHTSVQKLLILQKKVLRLICGVGPREHCKPLFIRLCLLTLPAMYILDCLLYVKKNLSDFTLCSQKHNYSTRQKDNLFIKYNNFSRTLNSFEVVALKLYNFLPCSIKELKFNSFKSKMKGVLLENPVYRTNEFFNINFSM